MDVVGIEDDDVAGGGLLSGLFRGFLSGLLRGFLGGLLRRGLGRGIFGRGLGSGLLGNGGIVREDSAAKGEHHYEGQENR